MKKRIPVLILGLCIILACSAPPADTLTQISTIDALIAGLYDGQMTCDMLKTYGDTGIGTFDRLDGEMVVLDNIIYQIRADGSIVTPAGQTGTPFASVTRFESEKTESIDSEMNFKAAQAWLDRIVPNQNLFCTIRIHGRFPLMKTRSVPAQDKPYPPLAEVSKKQSVFEYENVQGTIVGFRCPPYVQGVNVPGYHLHFISDDRKKGGHILDFEISGGICDIDLCHRFVLILPADKDAFRSVDLSIDRSSELEAIESAPDAK
ncbi:acetolactate decarboxylase [bacterium]|nr:acetolactate decarboxylase [bacterium]